MTDQKYLFLLGVTPSTGSVELCRRLEFMFPTSYLLYRNSLTPKEIDNFVLMDVLLVFSEYKIHDFRSNFVYQCMIIFWEVFGHVFCLFLFLLCIFFVCLLPFVCFVFCRSTENCFPIIPITWFDKFILLKWNTISIIAFYIWNRWIDKYIKRIEIWNDKMNKYTNKL